MALFYIWLLSWFHSIQSCTMQMICLISCVLCWSAEVSVYTSKALQELHACSEKLHYVCEMRKLWWDCLCMKKYLNLNVKNTDSWIEDLSSYWDLIGLRVHHLCFFTVITKTSRDAWHQSHITELSPTSQSNYEEVKRLLSSTRQNKVWIKPIGFPQRDEGSILLLNYPQESVSV